MSDAQAPSLLLAIAVDFLVPGTDEPLELAPLGARAIELGIGLSQAFGELAPNVDELLLFTHHLATTAESPGAAAAIRRAMLVPVIAAAGGRSPPDTEARLADRAKRLTKERHRARAEQGQRIADYLGAVSPHTPSARRRLS